MHAGCPSYRHIYVYLLSPVRHAPSGVREHAFCRCSRLAGRPTLVSDTAHGYITRSLHYQTSWQSCTACYVAVNTVMSPHDCSVVGVSRLTVPSPLLCTHKLSELKAAAHIVYDDRQRLPGGWGYEVTQWACCCLYIFVTDLPVNLCLSANESVPKNYNK